MGLQELVPAQATGWALGIPFHLDLKPLISPHIHLRQVPPKFLPAAQQQFERLGDF